MLILSHSKLKQDSKVNRSDRSLASSSWACRLYQETGTRWFGYVLRQDINRVHIPNSNRKACRPGPQCRLYQETGTRWLGYVLRQDTDRVDLAHTPNSNRKVHVTGSDPGPPLVPPFNAPVVSPEFWRPLLCPILNGSHAPISRRRTTSYLAISSRPMLTPYQRGPTHGLSSRWATVNHTTDAESAPSVCFNIQALKRFTHRTQNGITTEHHDPGTDFEEVSKILARSAATPIEHAPQIIQNSVNALLAAPYIDWGLVPPFNTSTLEPMSPYQSELRRQMEVLFPANHAVGAAPVPSVCPTIPFAV